MACASCSTASTIKGCRNNGGCGSGGCNKMNTFDWLSLYEFEDPSQYKFAEISFKSGTKKDFFINKNKVSIHKRDMVMVATGSGWDVGQVSLNGALAELQMKKKRVNPESVANHIIKVAGHREVANMHEARRLENHALVKSRAIARTLGLDMKIGDVVYQADLKKATFYYIADGRVDFRELVRNYAKEFRIKIEMRQIGARQESALIGGLGPCGRELCCSTWLSDFKSVSTVAARYQNLAINQAKLSGQCGRLKCCLNYELDTYLEALNQFPEDVDTLETQAGVANLLKLDIFKGIMYYSMQSEQVRNKIIALDIATVAKIKQMILSGKKPQDLSSFKMVTKEENPDLGFADVTGEIELPAEKRKPSRRKSNYRRKRRYRGNKNKRK